MSNMLPSYDKSQLKVAAQFISNALNNKKKNAKRYYSKVFYTYLIRIIMSNMEEHVLIQIS